MERKQTKPYKWENRKGYASGSGNTSNNTAAVAPSLPHDGFDPKKEQIMQRSIDRIRNQQTGIARPSKRSAKAPLSKKTVKFAKQIHNRRCSTGTTQNMRPEAKFKPEPEPSRRRNSLPASATVTAAPKKKNPFKDPNIVGSQHRIHHRHTWQRERFVDLVSYKNGIPVPDEDDEYFQNHDFLEHFK